MRRRLAAFYVRHERLLLGALTIAVLLVIWEGLARGWWADLLTPVLGARTEALRIRPIFLPSPSAIAAAVTNDMRSGSR